MSKFKVKRYVLKRKIFIILFLKVLFGIFFKE